MIKILRSVDSRFCLESPVKLVTNDGLPPKFSSVYRDGILIDAKRGRLCHAGTLTPFAVISGDKLVKKCKGWTDPLADYAVALIFPELWNPAAQISGYDLSDYQCHYLYDMIAEQFEQSDYNLVKLHLLQNL